MKRGVGTIKSFEVHGGIATVVIEIHNRTLELYAESSMTLDALTYIFAIPPPPAPPTDVVGRQVQYVREGPMLLELGAVPDNDDDEMTRRYDRATLATLEQALRESKP